MFKRTQPDVYSVQYLVARKQDSGIASSRQKVLWLIVGALLLISIVTISIVLGVVYARWEDHALFEDKQEGSSEDGYPDDTPIKAALQHDALQKDRQMQSINPTAVSPFAPSQDDQVLKPTDVHLHPVITPKRVSLGQFENEVEEVDVLEMTMSLPASVDVTSQEFEHEVAKGQAIFFIILLTH
ncbi:uncharacterized protein LOC135467508 [Liolophura sinensis]|uniref:uncharacterized protein LOC135467508 n=1 Tax=Liolophura sinensis TaxID=3198878 RepID=UPI003158F769